MDGPDITFMTIREDSQDGMKLTEKMEVFLEITVTNFYLVGLTGSTFFTQKKEKMSDHLLYRKEQRRWKKDSRVRMNHNYIMVKHGGLSEWANNQAPLEAVENNGTG